MQYIFKDMYKMFSRSSCVFTLEKLSWSYPVGYKIHLFENDVLKYIDKRTTSLFVFQDIEKFKIKTITIVGDSIGVIRK